MNQVLLKNNNKKNYDDLSNTRSEIDKYRVYIESLDEQIQGVYHLFYDTYGRSLKEYEKTLEEEIESDNLLRERQVALKKTIATDGIYKSYGRS